MRRLSVQSPAPAGRRAPGRFETDRGAEGSALLGREEAAAALLARSETTEEGAAEETTTEEWTIT